MQVLAVVKTPVGLDNCIYCALASSEEVFCQENEAVGGIIYILDCEECLGRERGEL